MKKLFYYMAVVLCAAAVASCSSDKDDDNGGNGNGGGSVPDPAGTITFNLQGSQWGDEASYAIENESLTIVWDKANTIYVWGSNNYSQEIADIGTVSSIGSIKKIPGQGFVSSRVRIACEPGHGYIIRVQDTGVETYSYYRLYVVENIIGSVSGYYPTGIRGAKFKVNKFTPSNI